MTRLLVERLQATVDTLVEWVASLVSGLTNLAPLLLGLACGCKQDAANAAVKPVSVQDVKKTEPAKPPGPDELRQIGKFNITFYYVVGEEEVAAKAKAKAKAKTKAPVNENHDGTLAAMVPPDKVTLYTKTCDPIAEVTPDFATQLTIQGTGKLRDGRVLNVSNRCKCGYSPCFKVIQAQWGTGGSGRKLQPFRSVAVDPRVVKLGSLLYVPLLEGRVMPGRAPWGGFVHDGCVVADDVGGGIKDMQIDFFVGRRGWFLGLSGSGGKHSWARHVPVFDGTSICERKGRQVGRRVGAI